MESNPLALSRPINTRFIVFLSLIIINGVYFVFGKYLIDERYAFSQQTQEVINKTIPGLNLSQQLVFNLTEIRRLQLRAVIYQDTLSDEQYTQKEKALTKKNDDIFIQYEKLIESPEEMVLFTRLKENWRAYLSMSQIATNLLVKGEKEKGRDVLLQSALTYLVAFERDNQELIGINNSYIASFSLGIVSTEAQTLKWFYIIMVINWLFQAILLIVLSKQYQTNTKAISDANIDPLTNLFNRRKILSEWNRLSPTDSKVIIIGDIDHFKHVNDTYGHNVGDFILIEVAKLLQQGSRGTDLVARVGGEEFAIIANNTTLEEAFIMVERIRKTIECTPFIYHSGAVINITISFGLSLCVNNDSSFEHALSLADKKLYQSKNEGRNKTSY
ncbi:diguanylate cyclase [Yersinia sp. 22-579]|uniref:GGDEF domain-containing protein n=1 Tax=Yersinia sp. 22-579 TaxID=3057580 RepID=UPI00263B232E|nr:diguanylate cyclase [Yersinia sp. 22-579]EKN6177458.1 diguanylate cyclase [Yersinia enterocolitica]